MARSSATAAAARATGVPGRLVIALALLAGGLCHPRPADAQEWVLSTDTGINYPVMVAAAGPDTVLAATGNPSSQGTIFRFDGNTWALQTILYPAQDGELTSVYALDSTHAWATGQTIPECQVFFFNGSEWTLQTEIGTAVWLYDIYAASAAQAWAVGGGIFRTTDAGATWVWQTRISDAQKAVHGTDGNHVWACGYHYSGSDYIGFFDGSSWTIQTTLDWGAASPRLTDIRAVGDSDVWACGNANGANGYIFHFDGSDWTFSTGPFASTVNSISARGANDVWAGLGSGEALRFDGASWKVQGAAGAGINSIAATLPDQAWAGSGDGRIYRCAPAPRPPWIHDYDGDGTSDLAIFRGSSGLWSIRNLTRIYLGNSADALVPSDYDGDGTSDAAIFRDSSGMWSVRNLSRFYLGSTGDQPVPGDYDGDGTAEAGIFRPASGMWSIRDATRIYLGGSDDIAVPGFYNGDAAKDIAVFRGSNGMWSVRNLTRFYFGNATDELVPGDYRGSGVWEAGVFRPSSSLWSIRNVTHIYLGSAADRALPADYDGNGVDDAGIFRDSAGLWSVRNLTRVYFGSTDDIPVTR